LLRVIAGIVRPDKGEVYIDDKLVNEVPPEHRNVAYFPQTYALFPHMTVLENVSYGLIIRGMDKEGANARALRILELVGLDERADSYPNELSGGMQQRVALARALATPSDILLLDEPLSALDAILRIELRFELRRMVKELNLTVIHVTHDQETALAISDRTVILRKGRIEQIGTPIEVFETPANIYVANFIGEMNFIPGVVVDLENRYLVVDIGGVLVRAKRALGRCEKGKVVLAIRPENLVVKDEEINKENWLSGIIDIASFSAGVYRYEILLKNGFRMIYKEPFSFIKTGFHKGDKVSVYLDPERIITYPYPAKGLRGVLVIE